MPCRPAPKTESLFDFEEKLAKEKEERYSTAGTRAGAPPPVESPPQKVREVSFSTLSHGLQIARHEGRGD